MQVTFNNSMLKKAWAFSPLFLIGFIVYDLMHRDELFFSFDFLSELDFSLHALGLFSLVCLMMLLNWSLEALKWKELTKAYHKMSFSEAFRSVISGVSTSFITPNRIGDFIGKLSYLPKGKRKIGLMSSAY